MFRFFKQLRMKPQCRDRRESFADPAGSHFEIRASGRAGRFVYARSIAALAVAVGFALQARAQTQTSFEKYLGVGGGFEELNAVIQTSDGGYLAVGRQYMLHTPQTNEWDAYLVKFDSQGVKLWDKTYDFGRNEVSHSIVEEQNGNFVIAGEATTPVTAFSGAHLFRINAQGQLAAGNNNKFFPGSAPAGFPVTTAARTVICRVQGSTDLLAISRQLGNFGTLPYHVAAVATRFNSSLGQVWQRHFVVQGQGTASITDFSDVVANADGGFTFAGSALDAIGVWSAIVIRTNGSGGILWSRSYRAASNQVDTRAVALSPTADGNYVFSSPFRTTPQFGHGTLLCKVNALNGDVMWNQSGTSIARAYRGLISDLSQSIRQCGVGDLTLSGGWGTTASSRPGLLRVDASGSPIFSHSYTGAGPQALFEQVVPTSDGGFIAAGNQDGTLGEAQLTKTDSTGTTAGCELTPFVSVLDVQMTTPAFVAQWANGNLLPVNGYIPSAVIAPLAVVPSPCESFACTPPPSNMVLWLPFDEQSGTNCTNIVSYPNGPNGVRNGTTIVAGQVERGLSFNGTTDLVQVPAHASLGVGTDPLTIDAWVKRPQGSSGYGTIVARRFYDSNTGYYGYRLWLNNGNVQLELDSGSQYYFVSTANIPIDGTWHHVAVTVERNSANGVKFYLDGNGVSLSNSPSTNGILDLNGGTATPLRVGADNLFPFSFLQASIDEVEVFRRALDEKEIQAIWRAGSSGKCKIRCALSSSVGFCGGDIAVPVSFKIQNLTGIASCTYDWWVEPLPAGNGTNIAGPTQFSQSQGSISAAQVPAFGWMPTPVSFSITRPAGMTPGGVIETAGYRVFVRNNCTGGITSCTGYVWDAGDSCVVGSQQEYRLPVGRSEWIGPVTLWNNGSQRLTRNYTITAHVADGCGCSGDGEVPPIIRLDGAEPGIPVSGTIDIDPGTSVGIAVLAEFVEYDPGTLYEIEFSMDLDADGMDENVWSVMLQNTTESACPGDLNDDQLVDLIDLTTLLAHFGHIGGTGQDGDINGDTLVDLLDLTLMLSNFGTICP